MVKSHQAATLKSSSSPWVNPKIVLLILVHFGGIHLPHGCILHFFQVFNNFFLKYINFYYITLLYIDHTYYLFNPTHLANEITYDELLLTIDLILNNYLCVQRFSDLLLLLKCVIQLQKDQMHGPLASTYFLWSLELYISKS